jgi:hypothetical protein
MASFRGNGQICHCADCRSCHEDARVFGLSCAKSFRKGVHSCHLTGCRSCRRDGGVVLVMSETFPVSFVGCGNEVGE